MNGLFTKKKLLNLRGELVSLEKPLVMGILNVTPDSFYDGGKYPDESSLEEQVRKMLDEGADIIDVGAYSSRPGADDVTEDEEIRRLSLALEAINSNFSEAKISIDTFRSGVAEKIASQYSIAMINDISGGTMDERLPDIAAKHALAYVVMHMKGTPATMQQLTHYDDIIGEMLFYFSERMDVLRKKGVNDIIIDPGFGFAKTLDDNYKILEKLALFKFFSLPICAGISRKSMIYKLLQQQPEQALNGTTALNVLLLNAGVDILRVHDVKEAKETVRIFEKLKSVKD